MCSPFQMTVHKNKRSTGRFYSLHCVYASGILISSIFPSLKRITQAYLHFGQNRGNSSNTVRGRICVLVLPPHLGQQSQSDFGFSVSVILYHLLACRGRDQRDLPHFAALGHFCFHIFERNFIDLRKKAGKFPVRQQ